MHVEKEILQDMISTHKRPHCWSGLGNCDHSRVSSFIESMAGSQTQKNGGKGVPVKLGSGQMKQRHVQTACLKGGINVHSLRQGEARVDEELEILNAVSNW